MIWQRLQAILPDDGGELRAAAACPFAEGSADEDEIAAEVFTAPNLRNDTRIGRYLATFGGWVIEEDFRERASSGGIGSWIQTELLRRGLVDAILNVMAETVSPGGAPLFRFTVARTEAEVRGNAKTRYYPVEMSGVIAHMRANPGRYAVIGVPCFARSLRLVARQDPVVAERLKFVLAIVCGHLKSGAFSQAISWQMGIHPNEMTGIDFRTKLENRPASRYGVTVIGQRQGEPVKATRPMEGIVGANWGHGLFKLKGCEFCDDVLGETADAAIGDAWLPAYDADPKGANVVVVRHPVVYELIRRGADEGRLHLDDLSPDEVAASQAGGLRHRRDGLAYRLWLTDKAGKWRPTKRVHARQDHLDPHMKRIHRLRFELGQKSHEIYRTAYDSGNLQDFLASIKPLVDAYEQQLKPTWLGRVANLLHRKAILIFRRG